MQNIRFDEQPFQLAAINAIADIFDGQYAADSQKLMEVQAKWAQDDGLLAGLEQDFTIHGNSIQVSDELLVKNLRKVQERNGIELPSAAESYKYGRNYTIEMETGTGKTYVYVRTALELARRYGWRKFMIVVPSIAIKEGVANAIETMREHLESIYSDVGYFNVSIYNSKNTGAIGDYARSEDVELLITTIDSFKRQDTHMNREQEDLGWQKPIDVLVNVQPIMIIDEPQSNMGAAGKAAIDRINALFTLRYSATHRRGEYYNLMYSLSPVNAHKENLVKTVYVRSAGLDGAASKPYVKLLDIRTRPTGGPEAKLEIDKRINGVIQKKQQWTKARDLEELTENDAYRGIVIDNISAREGSEHITFETGIPDLYKGDSMGGFDDQIMRAQIRSTIAAHLEREKTLKERGIKVLSLFFVDKVSSYLDVDDAGDQIPGKIQKWFVEELKEQLSADRYRELYSEFEIKDLYDAYFSVLKKKKTGEELIVEEGSVSSSDYKLAEAEAFERIMRDKKGLLDMSKPLRFIFSHSALKEGWDNPNVFQICMMRDANSPLDRRQTIGRGLRLPVDQSGVRSFDKTINQLTVIANESYEEFAANLQKEYVSEGVVFGKIRSNAFARLIDVETDKEIGFEKSKQIWQSLVDNGFVSASGELTNKFTPGVLGFELGLPEHLKEFDKEVQDAMQDYQLKNIVKEDKPVKVKYSKQILRNDDFNSLWDKINQKTTYRVDFSTDELINRAVELVANMPKILPVRVVMREGKLQYTQGGIDGADVAGSRTMSVVDVVEVPDIISFLQRETSLTRQTLADILIKSGRLGDLLINPTEFKFAVLTKIREVTQAVQIDKISYTIVPGRFTMSQRKLEEQLEQEVIRQLDKIYKVQRADRTLSDHIPVDSEVEKGFARKLDQDPNVEVFVKLPSDYKIPTPFGNYNPDWAYVYNLNGEKKLHLVRETKHTTDQQELQRETEKAKVACARVHYASIDVDYELATDKSPLVSI